MPIGGSLPPAFPSGGASSTLRCDPVAYLPRLAPIGATCLAGKSSEEAEPEVSGAYSPSELWAIVRKVYRLCCSKCCSQSSRRRLVCAV